MIGLQALLFSYCLVAQAADSPAIHPPVLSKRKFDSAAPAGQSPAGQDHHRGPSAYDRGTDQGKADRLLGDVDAAGGMAGDQQAEMGRVDPAPHGFRPPELLADALAGPHEGSLPAQAVPLVDALARAGDRESQRRIAVTYWRLSVAQAQLHYARANLAMLSRWIETPHKHSSLTASQLAAAKAAYEDADFRVINEAEALALLLGRSNDDRILVTVDRPHVGAYKTKFARVFASRTPPARLRLIDRTLPVSQRAIDVHGRSLVAAGDALKVTEEDYQQGRADYLTLAAASDRLVTAQSAFLASVLRYNEDIAEYALYVAPGGFNAKQLAKTLILRPAPAAQLRSEPPAERPASATEPYEPSAAGDEPAEPVHPTFQQDQLPTEENAPTENATDDFSASGRPKLHIRLASFQPPAELSHGGDYQGLLQAEPGRQAQELTKLLHWDRELPPESGEKITLLAGLSHVAPAQRRALITAYWDTRQQMALYQILGDRSSTLTGLGPHALAVRNEPGGPAAMLRLEAARLAAQAAVLDQHLRLLSAQYELVQLLETPADRPWPLPGTPPHGDNYNVAGRGGRIHSTSESGNEKPAAESEPDPLSLAATRVIVVHTELAERARALVFADEFRALHTHAQERRPFEIDGEVGAIDRQVRATDAFLSTLSNYNLAIADYILPLLPAETSAKALVGKLVVEEETTRPGVGKSIDDEKPIRSGT